RGRPGTAGQRFHDARHERRGPGEGDPRTRTLPRDPGADDQRRARGGAEGLPSPVRRLPAQAVRARGVPRGAAKAASRLNERVPGQGPVPAPSASPVAAAPAPAPAVAAAPDPSKPRIEAYGQVMFDAIHDAKTMNPAWQATLRPSQIPVQCPGDAGCGKDGAS